MKKERLTPRLDIKKTIRDVTPHNGKSKVKTKETFPTKRNEDKQHDYLNSRDQQSIQICLNLASYHKKEAQELKLKCQLLEFRLKDQLQDMESLRSQLNQIKASRHSNQTSKKELELLKAQNLSMKNENHSMKDQINTLNAKIELLSKQNHRLDSKARETQSLFIQQESKSDHTDMNTQTLSKISLRQQYANKYEHFSFVPSAACLQCARKDDELDEARAKYGNQLRQLQQQVNNLQRTQLAIKVMENQMVTKNECIDYLVSQVDVLQKDSKDILQKMTFLENKLMEVTDQNYLLKTQGADRLYHTFKSVA